MGGVDRPGPARARGAGGGGGGWGAGGSAEGIAVIAAGHWTRVRLVACGVVFGALFAAVGKRAFTLQIREGERLKVMAEEQYLREIELPPRRGRIFDRN